MSKKILKLSLILGVLTVMLSACSLPWKKKSSGTLIPKAPEVIIEDEEPAKNNTSQIKKFASYEELESFLKENNINNYSQLNSDQDLLMSNESRKNNTPLESNISSENSSYSTTNNQVAGVDESDIVKTDGTYIYALVRNELKIIKTNPSAETEIISVINFKSRPQGLFISGSSLLVFGVNEEMISSTAYKSFRRPNPYTFLKVFDLSDIYNPKLVRDLDFEGSYTDARLIGDYAYLFTSSNAGYVENDQVTPRVLDSGRVLANNCTDSITCYAPDIYYFDIPYSNYIFTNVTAINIKDSNEALSGQSYLMSASQNIYVSENNIYITYTQYLNEYEFEQSVKRDLIFSRLNSTDQAKINDIEKVASYILTKNEKQIKTALIIDRYLDSLGDEDRQSLENEINKSLKDKLAASAQDMEKTIIHKIGINGNRVEYRGMGVVNGRILNQFSMDEYNAYFRIVTTRSQLWSRLNDNIEKSYNNVYVLNKELKLVGALENLAVDEIIYSARFMGDRVYLVTFKQTDPLYVISLADPLKPSVLGAIKVPGYSTYLHPADQDGVKLIGFGRDAAIDESGAVKIKSLKLTLFDFTNLKEPKELDSYLIGNSDSDSIALYDHKAFLYSADKNLLVIPAVFRDGGQISFAGALAFSLKDNKLVLQGSVDHSDGKKISKPDFWDSFNYYDNTVKRSLYINNNLFTFSNNFLKINSLKDLTLIKSLALSELEEGDLPIEAPLKNETHIISNEKTLSDTGSDSNESAGLSENNLSESLTNSEAIEEGLAASTTVEVTESSGE